MSSCHSNVIGKLAQRCEKQKPVSGYSYKSLKILGKKEYWKRKHSGCQKLEKENPSIFGNPVPIGSSSTSDLSLKNSKDAGCELETSSTSGSINVTTPKIESTTTSKQNPFCELQKQKNVGPTNTSDIGTPTGKESMELIELGLGPKPLCTCKGVFLDEDFYHNLDCPQLTWETNRRITERALGAKKPSEPKPENNHFWTNKDFELYEEWKKFEQAQARLRKIENIRST